jgi:hypothetical protein
MENDNATEILAAARKYLSEGLWPTPLQGKRPVLPEWQKLPAPTDKDLQSWFANGKQYNVGIRCGAPSQIVVLDIDGLHGKQKWESVYFSDSLADKIKRTRKTKTGGGGIHVWFRYRLEDFPDGIKSLVLWRQPIQDVKPGEKAGEILVQGDGKQVVVSPSVHPTTGAVYLTNDKAIQELTKQEYEELLAAFGKDSGGSAADDHNHGDGGVGGAADKRGLTPEQIQDLLEAFKPFYKEGLRDNLVYGLSGMLHKENYSDASGIRFTKMLCEACSDEEKESRVHVVKQTFEKPPDKVAGWRVLNEISHELADQVAEILGRGAEPPKDDKAGPKGGSSSGGGNGKKKGKGQKGEDQDDYKRPYYVFKYSKNGQKPLAESVLIDGKAHFVIYDNDNNNKTGKLELVPRFEESARVLLPLDALMTNDAEPYSFKTANELRWYVERAKKVNIDHLWKCVKWFVKHYLDIDEHYKNIATAAFIMTYFLDRLPSTFYIFPTGEPGSGKGAFLALYELLAYRVVLITDPRSPAIYDVLGTIEKGQCSIGIDEANKLDENADLMNLLKAGTKSTARIVRVLDASTSQRKRERYFAYSMKVVCAETELREWKAAGLVSRSFIPRFIAGHPKYIADKVNEPSGDQFYIEQKAKFTDLRKLLFAYRLVHYSDPIPDMRFKLEGREDELCAPLIRLFTALGASEQLLGSIKSTLLYFINERRERKTDSFEHELFNIVKELIAGAVGAVSDDDTPQKLLAPKPVELTSMAIWEALRIKLEGTQVDDEPLHSAMETKTYGKVSRKWMPPILKRFGAVNIRIGHDRDRGYAFDVNKFNRASKLYNELTSIELDGGSSNNTADGADGADAYPGDKDNFDDGFDDGNGQNNTSKDAKTESNNENSTENAGLDDPVNSVLSSQEPSSASAPSAKQKQPGKSAYEAGVAASMADLKEFAGVVPLSKREPPSKKGDPPQKASIKFLEHVRKHCPEREASIRERLQGDYCRRKRRSTGHHDSNRTTKANDCQAVSRHARSDSWIQGCAACRGR